MPKKAQTAPDPQRELTLFVRRELTVDEMHQFGSAVAARHELAFDHVHPPIAIGELIKRLPSITTIRYLTELRRRKSAGESFLRSRTAGHQESPH